jgi:hypothetical protein
MKVDVHIAKNCAMNRYTVQPKHYCLFHDKLETDFEKCINTLSTREK